MSYGSISPQAVTVDLVDGEHMEDVEQGDSHIPPAARTFLERRRPAGSGLDRVDRDIDEDGGDNDGDDDNEAREQLEADGDLGVEAPTVTGDDDVAVHADPEVLVPLAQLFSPCPGATGVSHPQVRTQAQIDKHALDPSRRSRRGATDSSSCIEGVS